MLSDAGLAYCAVSARVLRLASTAADPSDALPVGAVKKISASAADTMAAPVAYPDGAASPSAANVPDADTDPPPDAVAEPVAAVRVIDAGDADTNAAPVADPVGAVRVRSAGDPLADAAPPVVAAPVAAVRAIGAGAPVADAAPVAVPAGAERVIGAGDAEALAEPVAAAAGAVVEIAAIDPLALADPVAEPVAALSDTAAGVPLADTPEPPPTAPGRNIRRSRSIPFSARKWVSVKAEISACDHILFSTTAIGISPSK